MSPNNNLTRELSIGIVGGSIAGCAATAETTAGWFKNAVTFPEEFTYSATED